MAQELKEVFDTIRIPVKPNETESFGAFYYHLASSADDLGQSAYPFNLIPVKVGNDILYTKRQGFTSGVSLTGGLPGGTSATALDFIPITRVANGYAVALGWTDGVSVRAYIIIDGTYINYITLTDTASSVYLTELLVNNVVTLGITWHNSDFTASGGYYVQQVAGSWAGAVLTQITDVDFPPQKATPEHICGPMVQMNDYVFVVTRGGANAARIYNSDRLSIANWNANGFINAFTYPDRGVRLVRYKNHIMCFGENSTEYYNDVGNASPASPLGRLDQAFMKIGIGHPRGLAQLQDTIFFMGQDATGQLGLYKLNQYTAQKISGKQEDNFLRSCYALDRSFRFSAINCNSQSILIMGGTSVVIEQVPGLLKNATYSGDPNSLSGATHFKSGHLAYNIDSEKFFLWGHAVKGASWMPLTIQLSSTGQNQVGYCIHDTGWETGTFQIEGAYIRQLWSGAPSYYDITVSVAINPIPCGFQTSFIDFGTEKRKRIHKLKLISKNPHAINQSSHYGWFLWNKGDLTITSTWPVNSKAVELQTNLWRPYIHNVGMGRQWTFGFAEISRYDLSIWGFEVDVSQCTA